VESNSRMTENDESSNDLEELFVPYNQHHYQYYDYHHYYYYYYYYYK
jgi:hypothetical protein